ncbi:uncharacterized protein K02A2.6-like [Phlebotomus papatasi]|uniref:uncharacterized protein K02A2.6-like n=1 Tax=Phlebotomus papatasi TaxID=29031 RepID=UPI002483FAF4|nr:uncharacterized protein K02A2.6-like [Phlebotomus papatasi]
MTGRKLNIDLNLLLPGEEEDDNSKRNLTMEQQFNKKHGAKKRIFNPGEKVFARMYTTNKRVWAPGEIIERRGNVNYNVLVQWCQGDRLIRSHCNQLRSRFTDGDVNGNSPQHKPPIHGYNLRSRGDLTSGGRC